MSQTIVIVGAGQAGGWSARTLRETGFEGTIVLVGEESHPPHERPPLSKAVLDGTAAPETTHLFKPEAFDQLQLQWRSGLCATMIDRQAHMLRLSDGSQVQYDKLILATGGRARRLPVPGMDLPHVHTLRTLADAQRLGTALVSGRRLVVIGGGWVGLEVAATARGKGLEVAIVEAQSRLCERSVPFEMSAFLRALHVMQGVEVLLDSKVEAIEASDGRTVVRLAGGTRLDCDLVVVGVGLIPNDELARAAGLACADGIVVDAQCRTSDPDIFAAGDVASAPNRWTGRPIRLESWQYAQGQGIAAARAALGFAVEPEPLPWFWSDQYGMNMQMYGVAQSENPSVIRGRPEDASFLLFHMHGDRVVAALGVGGTRDLRFARRLIETAKPVAAADLANTAIPLSKL